VRLIPCWNFVASRADFLNARSSEAASPRIRTTRSRAMVDRPLALASYIVTAAACMCCAAINAAAAVIAVPSAGAVDQTSIVTATVAGNAKFDIVGEVSVVMT